MIPGVMPKFRVKAVNYKPHLKNSLRGFVDIITPAGLRIKGCTWHESNGKEWVGFPGRQYKDESTGELKWANILEWETPEGNEAFQHAALSAIHELLDRSAAKGRVDAVDIFAS